ncbi:hypothetical protein SH1V18_24450 [Vallitalea longa]|uniref:Uncharacterized protein n=1 Tax=Vallitalea longa TaxID=2936439 RepID=A0A9W5Y9U1_9FIRM|nr:hypothetical protein SH1V18_24450 [Vallitalea longa]
MKMFFTITLEKYLILNSKIIMRFYANFYYLVAFENKL